MGEPPTSAKIWTIMEVFRNIAFLFQLQIMCENRELVLN